jgi:hypothetical protein
MEHSGFPAGIQVPPALLNNDVYVYFGDFLFKTDHPVTRFHWDRLAVNPGTPPGPPPTVPTPTPTLTQSTPTASTTPATATPTQTPVPTTASPTPTRTPTPAPATGSQTVTFDDRAGQDQPLDGQYPNGVIDWGSGAWYHSAPWQRLTTKNVSFTSGSTSQSFRFVTARRLASIQAYNGGSRSSNVSLSCDGKRTRSTTLAPGQITTIETGWRGTCTTVTVGSTNGWDTNFDNLVLDGG